MNEILGPAELNPNPEALDAKWYKLFELISSQNDVLNCLDGDPDYRTLQKSAFLSGEIENPNLDTKIDLEIINKEERELLDLKEKIICEEENEIIKQAYRWRINEKIAELRMLRASAEGDMRRFKRYAEFVYGKPSIEYFTLSVTEIKKQYEKMRDSKNLDILEAISYLDENLVLPQKETNFPNKPSEETIKAVHEIVLTEYEQLGFPRFSEDKKFSPEETVEIFEQALKVIGADDWTVILEERTAINVSQETKTIKIPVKRELELKRLQKLIMHEIKRHVERRISGEQSNLSLLGLGLDRYIKGEEGVTKVTEHGVEGKFTTYGTPEQHLAIGLAVGTGGQPKNFRETYEIMERVFFLKATREATKKNKPIDESVREDAQNRAWNICVRAFRGTDCKTPGASYTKDIVYREGCIAVWDVVMKDINEVYKFSIGKYDPSNHRHIWILSQLGITDDRLEKIELE